MKKTSNSLEKTKELMAALLRMPPKPHEEMKVGKAQAKTINKTAKKRAASKPKNA